MAVLARDRNRCLQSQDLRSPVGCRDFQGRGLARILVWIPYYLGHKAMWLSDFAKRLSRFATGRSDLATLPYGRDNTVFVLI
jgi:hypothetical protein